VYLSKIGTEAGSYGTESMTHAGTRMTFPYHLKAGPPTVMQAKATDVRHRQYPFRGRGYNGPPLYPLQLGWEYESFYFEDLVEVDHDTPARV